MIAVVGGLMASLELTHASTPILAAEGQPVAKAENKSEDKTVDKKEEAKAPAQENSGDSSKPTKSAEHSGVVIDADTGKPIAGATVTVTRMTSNDWRELAVTESLTDERGKYTFTIPPDQLSEGSLYIMFDVDHPQYARRHCGSYGYGMIVSNLKAGEQPWFSELKMVQGEKIVGRLLDAKQRPVAGASLRCDTRPKSGGDMELFVIGRRNLGSRRAVCLCRSTRRTHPTVHHPDQRMYEVHRDRQKARRPGRHRS